MKHFHVPVTLRALLPAGHLLQSGGLVLTGLLLPGPQAQPVSASVTVEASAQEEQTAAASPVLVVRDTGGMVCVYRDDVLLYETNIPVISLPEQDRLDLAEGITVADETEMHRLLEDLGA